MIVTHIIKTGVLQRDGRLLKWIESLNNHGIKSKVFILENENTISKGYKDGVEIESTYLISRKFFSSGKGFFLKVPEFTMRTFSFLRRSNPGVFVFHDMQHYLALFILSFCRKNKKQIVWDMHELPHSVFFKTSITKNILKRILENSDLLVYTNKERRDYIHSKLQYKEKSYAILNNYPDNDYFKINRNKKPAILNILREDKPYILWLGAANTARNFSPFLKVFEDNIDKYNLVILGGVEDTYKQKIEKYQKQGFVFNSFVKQDEMINYIDNALLSVVLYNNKSPNNFYCEPNRLYQLISRNIPLVVGHNPTMKRLVEELDCGVVLKDDGSDYESLSEGVQILLSKLNDITSKGMSIDKSILFSWDNQFAKVVEEIKKIL